MEFKLPDIGEGVHEGEITKWLVKAGDAIQADQPMVEVMTDKATVEIPSPVGGVVDAVFAKEGETVPVGKVIVTIREAGKAAPAPAAAAPKGNGNGHAKAKVPAEVTEAGEGAAGTKQRAGQPGAPMPTAAHADVHAEVHSEVEPEIPFHVLATPATRKLARDLSINLGNLEGTGPKGRVTKDDVRLAYEGQQAAEPRPSHPSGGRPAQMVGMAPAATALTKAPGAMPATRSAYRGGPAEERIPLKGIRKRIAEAMRHSKDTAAHFTYVEECDMTAVVALRKQAGEEAKRREIKLTFLPFIMKALVPVLKEFPMLNSSLDDERQEIVIKHEYNFGFATDTPAGLFVPVIHNVEAKSIWELAQEITELSERVRAGKAKSEDLKGGTFTLTNAGSIGGVFATPIINHPEVAILGVNAIRKRPVVVNDEIAIRDIMYFSISVDHRVVDGADAARFMNRLIYFLTDPTRLVFA